MLLGFETVWDERTPPDLTARAIPGEEDPQSEQGVVNLITSLTCRPLLSYFLLAPGVRFRVLSLVVGPFKAPATTHFTLHRV